MAKHPLDTQTVAANQRSAAAAGRDPVPWRAAVDAREHHLMSLKAAAARGPLPVELGWFHRYPARFGQEVLSTMLAGVVRRLQGDLAVCVDPFAGTGATMAACRQLGIGSVGVELSALGVEIARLRLHPPLDLTSAVDMIEAWTMAPTPARHQLDDDLAWWLGDANARAVSGYLDALADVTDQQLARFATVAISQALRPASRWLSGSVKVTADPNRAPPPIGPQLRRWVRAMGRDCQTEHSRVRSISDRATPAVVMTGDACALPLADGAADAAVTSPPYFVTYDYFEVNRLSYLAFDWPRPRALQVGMRYGHAADGVGFVPPERMHDWYREEFKGERQLFGRALRAYCQRMSTHMTELHRVLRPGGILAYALADSTRRGKPFELVAACCELLENAGFEVTDTEARGLGDTHILPVTRDAQSGRFASVGIDGVTERIVYARRR